MSATRELKSIEKIVIHCADTPNGLSTYTMEDIDKWHRVRGFKRQARPKDGSDWLHCGYHYVIHVDGSSMVGRTLEEVGAHAYGYNRRSIGICLIGRDAFTREQWVSLDGLLSYLRQLVPLDVGLCGHRDLSRKSCPGFDVFNWAVTQNGIPSESHICEPR